jgi:hypothetical protein
MLASIGGAGRAARGHTEALGRLEPMDFDMAYNRWPLSQLLIYTQIRNLHIKARANM